MPICNNRHVKNQRWKSPHQELRDDGVNQIMTGDKKNFVLANSVDTDETAHNLLDIRQMQSVILRR